MAGLLWMPSDLEITYRVSVRVCLENIPTYLRNYSPLLPTGSSSLFNDLLLSCLIGTQSQLLVNLVTGAQWWCPHHGHWRQQALSILLHCTESAQKITVGAQTHSQFTHSNWKWQQQKQKLPKLIIQPYLGPENKQKAERKSLDNLIFLIPVPLQLPFYNIQNELYTIKQ